MTEIGAREIPEEVLGSAATDGGAKAFHVGRREFKKWFDAPIGNFVMGNLPPHITELLEAKSDALIFSQETLAKQKSRHPEIAAEDYARVLNKIKDCGEIYDKGTHHIGLAVDVGRYYRLILKTAANGLENYIVSLCRLREDTLRSFRQSRRIK